MEFFRRRTNGILIMAVVFIFMAALVSLTSTVPAQHGTSGRYSMVFVTHAYEEVTSSTLIASITPGTINTSGLDKTRRAYITFSGQNVRWTADGTTPTTDIGIPTPARGSIELIGLTDIQNWIFINDDASGTATAHISLQYETEMK